MSKSTSDRISSCLLSYLDPSAPTAPRLTSDTDLLRDLGLCSDQGVELVLDMCDEFEIDFPKSFNPLVHPSGKRGMKLQELISLVDSMLVAKESA